MPGCPSGLVRANTLGAGGCVEDARAREQVVPQPRGAALGSRPRLAPANAERGAGRRAAAGRLSWTADPELYQLNYGSPVKLVQ